MAQGQQWKDLLWIVGAKNDGILVRSHDPVSETKDGLSSSWQLEMHSVDVSISISIAMGP